MICNQDCLFPITVLPTSVTNRQANINSMPTDGSRRSASVQVESHGAATRAEVSIMLADFVIIDHGALDHRDVN